MSQRRDHIGHLHKEIKREAGERHISLPHFISREFSAGLTLGNLTPLATELLYNKIVGRVNPLEVAYLRAGRKDPEYELT